ncbi:hypothetical protein, conserved [Eimeria necatrix]|uniref:Uncharacterized protein n=1 Tax=Eimeria necatrix TaxID=51315 RepID=U6MNW4_9EIME|nr:hypothetical protein, conserved [Eimeria necatrix]CDJ64144.1 hypothetical protein, conserved [Eimeria necatrix]
MKWLDVALREYLPAVQEGSQGLDFGKQFMQEVEEALELLDRELVLRAASESHQRLALQHAAAAAGIRPGTPGQ